MGVVRSTIEEKLILRRTNYNRMVHPVLPSSILPMKGVGDDRHSWGLRAADSREWQAWFGDAKQGQKPLRFIGVFQRRSQT